MARQLIVYCGAFPAVAEALKQHAVQAEHVFDGDAPVHFASRGGQLGQAVQDGDWATVDATLSAVASDWAASGAEKAVLIAEGALGQGGWNQDEQLANELAPLFTRHFAGCDMQFIVTPTAAEQQAPDWTETLSGLQAALIPAHVQVMPVADVFRDRFGLGAGVMRLAGLDDTALGRLPPVLPGFCLFVLLQSGDAAADVPDLALPLGTVAVSDDAITETLGQCTRGEDGSAERLQARLGKEVVESRPGHLVLDASVLAGSGLNPRGVARLARALRAVSPDIRVIRDAAWPKDEARSWGAAFGAEALYTGRCAQPAVGQVSDQTAPELVKTQTHECEDRRAPFLSGRFAPRNDIVNLDESRPLPPAPAREPGAYSGKGGNVIIGCMKNEGPFLLEWIAFHRAVGIDHFVIYSNDCSDSTDKLLDRLAELGIVSHFDNSEWKGNSPQQHALNLSLKLPVVQQAEWLLHIDTDEFMNIRTGDGTFKDLLAALPDGVTNIAMTWRMFGSSGVRGYSDEPVIAQFDRCAPSYMPKPHTAWGFKTAVRNVQAYQKLSCHRPNKLEEAARDKVMWVNGSGKDITKVNAEKGWRSEVKTIGYDLIQLNHYALRSAQSFLVKRQRGRALHVDRTVGLGYWVRMDWNSCRDVTIQRQLPNLEAELARLKADPEVARLHVEAVAWHRGKIDELMGVDEFRELFDATAGIDYDDVDRILWVLDNDMDS